MNVWKKVKSPKQQLRTIPEKSIVKRRVFHKFNAKPTTLNGIRFDSKKEGKYYQDLLLRQKSGEVLFFLRQVAFDLPGNVKYRCDFQEFLSDGEIKFIDVKGFKTQDYIMKKKMVEALYPVNILEA